MISDYFKPPVWGTRLAELNALIAEEDRMKTLARANAGDTESQIDRASRRKGKTAERMLKRRALRVPGSIICDVDNKVL
jgi:hypothetical protein